MRNLVALSVVVGLGVAVSLAFAADEPKFTIKQVMKQAHKDGLLKKVAAGDGSAEDAKKLLELYTALAANKPPKGEEAAWKEKTGPIVEAAKKASEGAEGAGAALTNASLAACTS
jgi:hypothetical protein